MTERDRNKEQEVALAFKGQEAEVIQFDQKRRQAFVLAGSPTNMLVVAWDIDKNGQGRYRIKVIGTKDGEPVTKELEPGNEQAAFFGEISVIGAKNSELFASFGYQDDDVVDDGGFVVNKVKEVKIVPNQED